VAGLREGRSGLPAAKSDLPTFPEGVLFFDLVFVGLVEAEHDQGEAVLLRIDLFGQASDTSALRELDPKLGRTITTLARDALV
jgi:hypothetical protein